METELTETEAHFLGDVTALCVFHNSVTSQVFFVGFQRGVLTRPDAGQAGGRRGASTMADNAASQGKGVV